MSELKLCISLLSHLASPSPSSWWGNSSQQSLFHPPSPWALTGLCCTSVESWLGVQIHPPSFLVNDDGWSFVFRTGRKTDSGMNPVRQTMTLGGEDGMQPNSPGTHEGWRHWLIIYSCMTLRAQCTELIISKIGPCYPNLWGLPSNRRRKGEKWVYLEGSGPFLFSGESSSAHFVSDFQFQES